MRLPLFLAFTAALPAAALELELTGFYDLNRPASLEYDPAFCGLWIANEGPETALVTLDGLELRRWRSDLYRIKALAIDGNDLIVADGNGLYQRMSKDGVALGDPYRIEGVSAATEGMVVLPNGTIVIVEDDPARMFWVAPDGAVTRVLDGNLMDPPMTEPQGVAFDPRTGTLLVVDDLEGTNALFEFTAEGAFLATISLVEYGIDPEGIAIRPGADALFLGFDEGARIAAFTYTPSNAPGPLDNPSADCMLF
ncbi:MAG: hypothetical protein AAF748_01605 [Pseudomonadota bacterium]